MAKHEVVIRENTGTTKTDAPYLPLYIKKSDLAFAALCAQVAAESGLTDTQVRAIFEGAFAEFETLEQDAAVRIHVDGMTVCMAIYGSFATADAAFDPVKNTLALAIYLDDDIKNALVNVTPTIVTDETATKVRITVVSDCEDERPYEVIYGLRSFNIQGYNLVMSDEGAEAYLENAAGAKFPCSLSSQQTKQVLKACMKTLLEPGDYKLVVKSRGGDAEGPLQTVFRKVKYIKAEPVVTGVEIEEWTVTNGGTCNHILGRNLPTELYSGENPTNSIAIKFVKPGEETETIVSLTPFPRVSKSNSLLIQPVYVLEKMTGMAKGDSVWATLEVKCGEIVAGTVELLIIKGA